MRSVLFVQFFSLLLLGDQCLHCLLRFHHVTFHLLIKSSSSFHFFDVFLVMFWHVEQRRKMKKQFLISGEFFKHDWKVFEKGTKLFQYIDGRCNSFQGICLKKTIRKTTNFNDIKGNECQRPKRKQISMAMPLKFVSF